MEATVEYTIVDRVKFPQISSMGPGQFFILVPRGDGGEEKVLTPDVYEDLWVVGEVTNRHAVAYNVSDARSMTAYRQHRFDALDSRQFATDYPVVPMPTMFVIESVVVAVAHPPASPAAA